MTLEIARVDDSWEARYRTFCEKQQDILIYYHWGFRRFLIDLLGCRPLYLAAVDQHKEIHGILPLMATEGPFGTVLNSLPFFGSNGGVIATDEMARRELWRAYADMLKEPGLAAATVIENPLLIANSNIPYDMLDHRVGQVTFLKFDNDPATGLMRILDPTARRNIQKAERSCVEVGIDNAALPELEAIHRENMMEIGGRVKPHEFFELIPQHFRPGIDWNLFVARRNRAVVAALLLFYSGNTVDYYIPGTRLDERVHQPAAAIIRHAMLDAYARGRTIWNWGGTWLTQDGVLRFKRKWGAVDKPYCYYIRVVNPSLYDADRATLLDAYGYFYVLPFERLVRHD